MSGLVAGTARALKDLWSLVLGLGVTGSNFLKPQETVHYPRQEVDTLDTFRGHIELVPSDENPGKARCVGCGLCAALCPSGCIAVVAKDPPEDSGACFVSQAGAERLVPMPRFRAPPPSVQPVARELLGYRLTYHACSLCGLCVQNCPAGSLRFSGNVYFAGDARGAFELDLMDRLARQARTQGR